VKKTFKLQVENKNPDRVVDSIKHEVRKYIKREQKKALPKDKDFWFFDCKFAKNDEEPKEIAFSEIIKSIDEAASLKCESFYMEIVARAEIKKSKEIKNEIIEEDI